MEKSGEDQRLSHADRIKDLSRREKLEVVREVLGDRMPSELLAELEEWKRPHPEAPPHPAATAGESVEDAEGKSSRPEAPLQPGAAANQSAEDTDNEVDLADGMSAGVFLPLDNRPLELPEEVARAARRGKRGLAPFLSFENIIFLLSAILILGGTIYFAAVTWNKVPSQWQFFFLETVVLFYGALLLGGATYLGRRLKLQSAARFLITIAGSVAAICALIAASSFRDSLVAGWLGAGLAALVGGVSMHRFGRTYSASRESSILYGGAVATLALAGGAGEAGLAILAGGLVLVSTLLVCWRLPKAYADPPLLLLAWPAAILLSAPLLVMADLIRIFAIAPAIAAGALLGLELRRLGYRWGGFLASILASLAALATLPHMGATAAALAVGIIACVRSSALLPEQGGSDLHAIKGSSTKTPPTQTSSESSNSDSLDKALSRETRPAEELEPSRFAARTAGILFFFLALIWAPAIGQLLPAVVRNFLIDLVAGPDRDVSASWDALAALPFLALPLYVVNSLPQEDQKRARIAEKTAWAVLAAIVAMSLIPLDKQPMVSGTILLLTAATWMIFAFKLGSNGRKFVGYLLGVATSSVLAYAIQPDYALPAGVLAALLILAGGRASGRYAGALSAAVLLAALLGSSHHPAEAIGLGFLLLALLLLLQPGPGKVPWLRIFGPASLLAAILSAAFYAPGSSQTALKVDQVPLILAGALCLGGLWLAIRLGPRFLYYEVTCLAIPVAAFALTAAAQVRGRYLEDNILGASIALVALLLAARAAGHKGRVFAWWIVLWTLPVCVTIALDDFLELPAMAAAALGSAGLFYLSRRLTSPLLALAGCLEGLVASFWAIALIAQYFSSGGNVERVFTALGIAAIAWAFFVARSGERLSALSGKMAKRFALACLGLSLLLIFAGVAGVGHPKGVDITVAEVALLAIVVFSVWLAGRYRVGWLIYLTEGAFAGMYAYLRTRTNILYFLEGYDGLITAFGAMLFLAVARILARRKSSLGVDESTRVATLLPLAIPFLIEWEGNASESLGILLGGLIYGHLARDKSSLRYGWLSALLLNLALIPVWIALDLSGPMVYFLPVGLSVLLLEKIYRSQLKGLSPVLRTLAALLILGSTSLESFEFDSLLPALLLALLSIAAVLLGIVWRLRAYLYTGFVFLLMDFSVNLTRWGMEDRLVAGTLGVAVGVALFMLGVLVARHKEQLLKEYHAVKGWEW